MKKILVLSLLFGQFINSSVAQITINATDIPVPYTTNLNTLAAATNPALGNGQAWSFTSTPVSSFANIYNAETFQQWLNIGVDVYISNIKYLNPNFFIDTWVELDHSNAGVQEKGINISEQNFDLAAFTGNSTDSIFFPEQDVFYNAPKVLMPFPMNSSSKQNYVSGRNVVNFTLNSPSNGLNMVPCQMVYYDYRADSVIGYGTLRVYTPAGPSAPYDVLMQKSSSYTQDSFYLAGAPAPTAVQAAFSISQGQKTAVRNSYNFLRKGNFNYLARAFYGADNTFSTMSEIYTCADNVAPLSITEKSNVQFSTFIYPNPSTQTDVHLKLLGASFSNFENYTITNQVGAIMHSEKINSQTDELVLPTRNLSTGIYFISLLNKEGKITSEKIIVN
jgi:hypothetical protein